MIRHVNRVGVVGTQGRWIASLGNWVWHSRTASSTRSTPAIYALHSSPGLRTQKRGGSSGEARSLEQTPTWAVAVVCFVLVLVSIIIEQIIHLIAKWLKKRHKHALYEALEKIKSELMLLGFISLLLTVLQSSISKICITQSVGNSWHPCKESKSSSEEETSTEDDSEVESRRKLLWMSARRILAGGGTDKTDGYLNEGKVPLISSDGIHQLHIFIFVLAVFHVLYCVATLALGRLKDSRQYFSAWSNSNMDMVVIGVQSKPFDETLEVVGTRNEDRGIPVYAW
ncbi:hypothetical protein ACLOJK_001509 [Asimina triloba]